MDYFFSQPSRTQLCRAADTHRKEVFTCRSSNPKLLQPGSKAGRQFVYLSEGRIESVERYVKFRCSKRKHYGLKVTAFQDNEFPPGVEICDELSTVTGNFQQVGSVLGIASTMDNLKTSPV